MGKLGSWLPVPPRGLKTTVPQEAHCAHHSVQMKVFTMVLQTDQRRVLPVAHCLAAKEDTPTVTRWLFGIQARMPGGWKPSCMLTDASQVQIGAAKRVGGGVGVGLGAHARPRLESVTQPWTNIGKASAGERARVSNFPIDKTRLKWLAPCATQDSRWPGCHKGCLGTWCCGSALPATSIPRSIP